MAINSMSNIVSINAQNLQQVLGETSQQKLVLLNFHSPQSPECISQIGILENLATQYKDHIVVANLDCDAEQALASQLAQQVGLQTLPTLVLLKDSAPVDLLAGAQTDAQIREALSKHLPAQQDLLLEQAKQALLKSDLNAAFNYAKQAYEIDSANARIKLVLADICIQIHKLDDAQELKNQSEKKTSEYNKILNQAKQEAKKILDGTRTKVNRDIENKKKQFNLEIKKEIEKAEKEIKTLQLSSIKNINKIAIETSSEIVRKIVGTEVNASSVSAIVEDISKKEITKYI